MSVDAALLEKLICPLTRTALRFDAEREELVSEAAGLAYPIVEGTPVMLVEEARILDRAGGDDDQR